MSENVSRMTEAEYRNYGKAYNATQQQSRTAGEIAAAMSVMANIEAKVAKRHALAERFAVDRARITSVTIDTYL
jgi:hypothetical protein